MTTLIKKDKTLQELLDIIPETEKGTKVRKLINQAIEKAYKSGLIRFNALDNTMVEEDVEVSKRIKWHSGEYNFETGENATLIRTYLNENGYVD